MNRHIPVAGALALLLGLSMQTFAQSSQPRQDQSFTHGESKHCESLSGEAKVQCDREEANKGQAPEAADDAKADDAKTPSDAPAAGGSSSSDASQPNSPASTGEGKSDPRSD